MNRLKTGLLTLSLLFLAAGLGACGGGGGGTPDPGTPSVDGFTLNVLQDSYLGDSSAKSFSVAATPNGATTTVEISVNGARDLKALYCDLRFDASKYNPTAAVATNALGASSELLQVFTAPEKGKLYFGAVLTNSQMKPGYSGSGVIARVTFANEAQPKMNEPSGIVSSVADKVPLSWNEDTATLKWNYYNTGDYNQDGVVGLTDLTPLSLKYGQGATGASFAAETLEALLDGNHNGMLDVNDVTAILNHWGQDVANGYNIYASAKCEAYPVYDVAPSTISPLAALPLSTALGDPAQARLEFAYQVADPIEGVLYWVRPVSGNGGEGISSDLLLGDPATPGLWVTNPPAISPAAPYVVENGDTYKLIVDDPADGEVTLAAGTHYSVEPAEAGTVSAGVLTVSNTYSGWFSVHATYNGAAVKPGAREVSQSEDNGGLGFYIPEPDSVFALPSKTEVHKGERITVTVYTYEAANPLEFMNCVTFELGRYARYVPNSFNLGVVGNDPYISDGIWSQINPVEYAPFPDNWIETYDMFDVYRLGFPIAGRDGTPVSNATGALFNFELLITGNTPIVIVDSALKGPTCYSVYYGPDATNPEYHWTHCDNAGVPLVTTFGDLPSMDLRLVDPPSQGDGTQDNPYQITGGQSYSITLLSDVYGDLTLNPNVAYTVVPDIAGTLSNEDAILVLDPDYSGTIQIKADYGGISTTAENSLYLFLTGAPRDDYFSRFHVNEETYLYGGSADDISLQYENYTDTNEHGYQEEFLKVDVVATNASHLKGLYFEMTVQGDLLKYYRVHDKSAMEGEDGLLSFPDQFYRDFHYKVYGESNFPNIGDVSYGRYSFAYSQCMIHPQTVAGFSGNGVLVSLLFRKAPQPGVSRLERVVPKGEDNIAPASFDPVTHIFKWYYYNVGDYDQSLYVDFADIFPLAVHFGETVTGDENTIQAVIDGDHDGQIYFGDLQAIIEHWRSAAGGILVYCGTESQFPAQGTDLIELDNNMDHPSQYLLGDPATERLWHEYPIADPQSGNGYWVCPYAQLWPYPMTEFIPGL